MTPQPFSFTSYEQFVNCPEQFHQVRVLKNFKDTGTSEEMLWGRRVHEAFEHYFKYKKELPEELKQHLPFLRRLAAIPGTIQTEHKYALNKKLQPCQFFADDVFHRGVIDVLLLLDSGVSAKLIDYKTGKRKPKPEQLMLNAFHTWAKYPQIDIIDAEFYWTADFIPPKPTGDTTIDERAIIAAWKAASDRYVWGRKQIPELWEHFLPNLRQYMQAFKEDVWQKRPSGLCKQWCPVLSCEHNGKSNPEKYRWNK